MMTPISARSRLGRVGKRTMAFPNQALRREDLSGIPQHAEFSGVRWLMPVETGFCQPIVLTKRE
jgi:hypothetical protein